MELYSVFVTGANRGIGLEFVRQLTRLQKPPRYIFATYRSAASLTALKEVKESSKESNVVLIQMDVTKLEDIVSARKVVEQTSGENGLTLLINNAGADVPVPFPEMTEEGLLTEYKINAVGPVRIFQELLPLLEKAASRGNDLRVMSVSRSAVINISSMGGSITRTGVEFEDDFICPGYKMSKAALNMAMRVIAAKVKSKGILVVMMCPGWVKTDMGTEQGEITPEESISTMLQTFAKLNDAHHGTFMDRMGNPYPF